MKRKTTKTRIYELHENNSGGSWWLDRKQYERLFADGWYYEASDFDKKHGHDTKAFLGDDDNVPWGWRNSTRVKAASIREAVERFERATGANFFDQGCSCCGVPFSIASVDGEPWEHISGSDGAIEVHRPW